MRDLKEAIEKVCRIRTKSGKIKKFELYDWQKDFLDNLGKKNIILKARQIGFSTLCSALFYIKAVAGEGINAKIVANKKEIAQNLFDTVRIIHDNIPEKFRPQCDFERRNELFFTENKSRLSITSSIKDAGRGETIHMLLCSEMAFWETADETMLGLLECVPKDGLIIIESTPNGIGNWFYRWYKKTERQETSYSNFKYDWSKHPEYDEEWAEQKKKEKGEQGFAQEYGCDFITSSRGIFNDLLGKIAEQKPIEVINEPHCSIKTFEEPVEGEEYRLGADSSGGYSDGDYSSITIFNARTRKIAFTWHGHLAPDLFGIECLKYGTKYNNAFAGIEVNNHGLSTINAIKDEYENLYMRERRDRLTNTTTKEVGWNTTPKTRDEMIDTVKSYLREDCEELPISIIEELKTFVRKENGRIEAEEGCHDDQIFSMGIGLMMIEAEPYWEYREKERAYMGRLTR